MIGWGGIKAPEGQTETQGLSSCERRLRALQYVGLLLGIQAHGESEIGPEQPARPRFALQLLQSRSRFPILPFKKLFPIIITLL